MSYILCLLVQRDWRCNLAIAVVLDDGGANFVVSVRAGGVIDRAAEAKVEGPRAICTNAVNEEDSAIGEITGGSTVRLVTCSVGSLTVVLVATSPLSTCVGDEGSGRAPD